MNEQNDHGGEGIWLLVILALVALGAKPAADAAPPHHTRHSGGTLAKVATPPLASSTARAEIPADYLALYRSSAKLCPGLPWAVLAGIGKVETNHGRSRAPGVISGINSFGCCAGLR